MSRRRYAAIDAIRGIALINMIAYHAAWDLVYLFHIDWPWYHSAGAQIWQQIICSTFMFLPASQQKTNQARCRCSPCRNIDNCCNACLFAGGQSSFRRADASRLLYADWCVDRSRLKAVSSACRYFCQYISVFADETHWRRIPGIFKSCTLASSGRLG